MNTLLTDDLLEWIKGRQDQLDFTYRKVHTEKYRGKIMLTLIKYISQKRYVNKYVINTVDPINIECKIYALEDKDVDNVMYELNFITELVAELHISNKQMLRGGLRRWKN